MSTGDEVQVGDVVQFRINARSEPKGIHRHGKITRDYLVDGSSHLDIEVWPGKSPRTYHVSRLNVTRTIKRGNAHGNKGTNPN